MSFTEAYTEHILNTSLMFSSKKSINNDLFRLCNNDYIKKEIFFLP